MENNRKITGNVSNKDGQPTDLKKKQNKQSNKKYATHEEFSYNSVYNRLTTCILCNYCELVTPYLVKITILWSVVYQKCATQVTRTSTVVNGHQRTLGDVNGRKQTFININRRQQTLTYVNGLQQTSTYVNGHQHT